MIIVVIIMTMMVMTSRRRRRRKKKKKNGRLEKSSHQLNTKLTNNATTLKTLRRERKKYVIQIKAITAV